MNLHADVPSSVAARYMHWQAHQFTDGPLRFVLMHVTADPSGFTGERGDCRVQASARLVLRSGAVYGVGIASPYGALVEVCQLLAGTLAAHAYDEDAFSVRDRELAAALRAAGYAPVRATLERSAPVLPKPAVAAGQLHRLVMVLGNPQRAVSTEARWSTPASVQQKIGEAGCYPDSSVVEGYREELDAHALAYMENGQSVCGVPLDRLSVYNLIASGAETGRYRAQAVQALPWLLPVLVAPGQGRREEITPILAAIDAGSSLHAAVAAFFHVPREVVRWLGRRAMPDDWRLDIPRLRRLLAMLSWLAPERRPQNPSQFGALIETCNSLAGLLRFDPDRGRGLAARLERHGPCMRRWLADLFRPRPATQAGSGNRERLAPELLEAGDFLRVLAESVQDRYGTDHASAAAAVLRWCAVTGLRHLAGLSREWHAFTDNAVVPDCGSEEVLRWPAILPQPWQHGPISVTELTSSTQLLVEGLRMRHCVASLDRACHEGHSAIMSLRSESGDVVSTAELRLSDGPDLRIDIEQHKSMRNGPPATACELALAALVRHLNHTDAAPLLRSRRDFQRRQCALARGQAAEARVNHELHAGQARDLAWRLASCTPGAGALRCLPAGAAPSASPVPVQLADQGYRWSGDPAPAALTANADDRTSRQRG